MMDTNLKWSRIIAFNDEYFPKWREDYQPIFGSNALAGEAGEVCNKIKKFYGGGTNKDSSRVSESDIVEECVDVYIYMVLLCESLGYGHQMFSEIFDSKMAELHRRMTEKANKKRKI